MSDSVDYDNYEGHQYFTRIVAPTIGSILGFILNCASYKTYREVERSGKIGQLSVLPQLVLHVNCLCWMIYAFAVTNYPMFPINAVGTIFTLMYINMYYSASDAKKRRFIEIFCIISWNFCFLLLGIVAWVLPKFSIDPNLPLGVICNIPNILFFASPLATIAQIFREKSVATLSFPLTLTSLSCATFWFFFGLGTKNAFIIIPNVLGCLFSTTQVVLFAVFRKSTKPSPSSDVSPYAKQVDEVDDAKDEGVKVEEVTDDSRTFSVQISMD